MRYVKINVIILSIMVSTATAPRASGQVPEGWEIVEITNDPNFYDDAPDINDRGQVVFHRTLFPDWSTSEIMMFDRGTLVQITDDDVYDAFPRINNHGEIVWARDVQEDGDTDIVLWRDGEIIVLSDAPYYENGADINNLGQMVWNGHVYGDAVTSQLFFFDGNSIQQITDNGLSNQGARINENTQIVWTRYDFSVSPWTSEIMLWEKNLVTQLSNGQGQMQSSHLNDLTQVVWASPQAGVELWDSGVTVQILDDGGAPHINNRADVCVSRWDTEHSNYGMWIFTGGLLVQLTDGSFGGGSSEINRRGEVPFTSGFFPAPNIALFTNPLFIADLDLDADVDLGDLGVFQRCFSSEGGEPTDCGAADFDGDLDVDLADFAVIQGLLSGPG